MTVPDAAIWLPWLGALVCWVILMMAVIGLSRDVRDLTHQMEQTAKASHRVSERIDLGYFNVEKLLAAAERYGSKARPPDVPRSEHIFNPGEPPLFSSVAPRHHEDSR